MVNKFNFEEVVRVVGLSKSLGLREGIVVDYECGKGGRWRYNVMNEKGVWCIDEKDLESTGQFGSYEDLMSGESIRVGVTEGGEGYLIKDEETPDR